MMLIGVIESRVNEVSGEDSCSNDMRFVEVEVEYLGMYDIFVPDRPSTMNDMVLCGHSCINVVA